MKKEEILSNIIEKITDVQIMLTHLQLIFDKTKMCKKMIDCKVENSKEKQKINA